MRLAIASFRNLKDVMGPYLQVVLPQKSSLAVPEVKFRFASLSL